MRHLQYYREEKYGSLELCREWWGDIYVHVLNMHATRRLKSIAGWELGMGLVVIVAAFDMALTRSVIIRFFL